MQFRPVFVVVAATVIFSLSCAGASITNITVMNNSGGSFVSDEGYRVREFRTESFTPAKGTPSGNSVSFTNRFAWMSAQRVFPGRSDVLLSHASTVAYDLTFTVDDPLSLGYSLTIDSLIRGYVTAFWESNSSAFPSVVFAAGTGMAATFNDGSGFGPLIPELATDLEIATATDANPFVNRLVSRAGGYAADTYTGTRVFTLRYSTMANNASAALQNFNTGEADVRFGLDPTSTLFLNAAYPGVDGEAANTHGHFLTITADFNEQPSPVPEPGSFSLMLAASLLWIGRKWKRRPGKAG